MATQLAAVGHLVRGGFPPDTAILLIGAVTIGAVASCLTLTPRRWISILGVMAVGQLAFHLLFTVDGHGGTSMSMAVAHPFVPAAADVMVSFHLIADASAALLLATVDTAIFSLFCALRRAAALLRPQVCADRPLRTAEFADLHLPRPGGALLAISPRRGPPVALS